MNSDVPISDAAGSDAAGSDAAGSDSPGSDDPTGQGADAPVPWWSPAAPESSSVWTSEGHRPYVSEPSPTLAIAVPPQPPRTGWTLSMGVAFVLAGLLAGGALGARAHDALSGDAAKTTDSVAAPVSPGTLPAQPTVPVQPTVPAQPTVPVQPTVPALPQEPDGSGRSPAPATPPSDIAAKVTPSVVDVFTTLSGGAGAGTGMILTSSGDVLTNNHVVEGATSIRVVLVTTGRSYVAKVVGTDATDDVAVLRLSGATGLHPISAANSADVSVGDAVVALGNAGGKGGAPSVVFGSVVGTNRSITVSENPQSSAATGKRLTGLIQTDAPIEPGDSGGPLVDTDAKVIGMDTAASVGGRFGSAAEGYAIPINKALAIARQIQNGQASSTVRIGVPGLLGISVLPNDDGTGSGVQIADVASGSPAASAGLVSGDTITTVDGRSVSSGDALTKQIRSHRPGDRIRIGWVDGSGSRHSATVRLAEGPPD